MMDSSSTKPRRLVALIVTTAIVCIAGIALFPTFVQQLSSRIRNFAGATSQPSSGSVLLSDDFSSPQWGTATNAENAVEYADNALQMIVYAQNSYVLSPPNDNNYQNIHMEVTAINNGTDSTTAFGLICNRQSTGDSFYYFAITPAGQYAIAKATQGQSDVFLTNEDQWAASDLIPKDAASYRIGTDCGSGILTLYVDGQEIDSVSDSSYTNGGVALFTWSGEEATTTNVSFDDFLMTTLP
jgi:hypothetical protein